MRGVLNLRGVMVPIIDLRCRFGQGMTEATPLHVVIVVQIGTDHVGLLADRVLDIVGCDASQVQPVPRVAQASRVDFLSGLVTIESGDDRADRPVPHSVRVDRRRRRDRNRDTGGVENAGKNAGARGARNAAPGQPRNFDFASQPLACFR